MKSIPKMIVIYLVIASSTAAQIPLTGYTIDGFLAGLKDNTSLYLARANNRGGVDTIARAQSYGDRFHFNGKVSQEGESYFILIDTSNIAYKGLKPKFVLVHMENTPITIYGRVENLSPFAVKVEGSGVHDDLMEYARESKERFKNNDGKIVDLYKTLFRLPKDSSVATMIRRVEVKQKIDSLKSTPKVHKLSWIRSHLNSLISPWLLQNMPDSVQRVLYPELTARVRASYYGVLVKKMIDRNQKLSIGRKAPELILAMPDGKMLSLHAVTARHKLTIVDFWAYWCVPCRRSFPAMKEMYEKYSEKGLAIYGVSIDSKKPDWLKALKQDDLPWYNVIVQKDRNMAKELYGVTAVPSYLLLDQQGRILLKWRGGEETQELDTFLSTL